MVGRRERGVIERRCTAQREPGTDLGVYRYTKKGRPSEGYRRDGTTWAAFGALFAFGFMNAVLGPALPYLREVEHISYLVGALHQAAYAVGGGVAGLLAVRERNSAGRTTVIAGGVTGAALAGLALGYRRTPASTIPPGPGVGR